jgi:hypothetical protein
MKSTRRIPIAMFLGLATMGSAMAQDKAAGPEVQQVATFSAPKTGDATARYDALVAVFGAPAGPTDPLIPTTGQDEYPMGAPVPPKPPK